MFFDLVNSFRILQKVSFVGDILQHIRKMKSYSKRVFGYGDNWYVFFVCFCWFIFFYILKNLSTIIEPCMIIDRGILEEDGEIMSFFIY